MCGVTTLRYTLGYWYVKRIQVHYYVGILSKSLGQILRVAASMNVLFQLDSDEDPKCEISKTAIDAAIHFVENCCQEAAFVAGRGRISEEIKLIEIGMYTLCVIVSVIIQTWPNTHATSRFGVSTAKVWSGYIPNLNYSKQLI